MATGVVRSSAARRPRARTIIAARIPGPFQRTRCVFADADGYCELEKFARSNGHAPLDVQAHHLLDVSAAG